MHQPTAKPSSITGTDKQCTGKQPRPGKSFSPSLWFGASFPLAKSVELERP